ncbi:efflux RND transporter periplasmic adaptor subunit [Flavobacterium sp. 7A]|uniref:efflux RND transporter periplasmic adaptor subunit n=1 Tax=Flavobacterium sp. 7A TaxID=2940571 RepID=UPI002226241D|nr:biotin/lipoyl-binding protein [Flavobacterium sp. 7A]MCW2118256.1 hypothetical protein [Flavobacterium sp. 7A]
MPTITGTGKQHNIKMKHYKLYFLTVITLLLFSCGKKTETTDEVVETPKTLVKVARVMQGSINDELTLFGTTAYLKRNLVTASIPAFITQVHVKLGDQVKKGDLLYVLESKESRALGNNVSKIDDSLNGFGIIKIKASASGIITTLDKQQAGDYVLEGALLCTIAESNDLIFQVNVPFEYTAYTQTGKTCTIILPNNLKYTAIFTKALMAMNVNAQTQTILAKCNKTLFLPENMIVKVSLNKGGQSGQQLLPKSCVSSDEMMKEFWIMIIKNDSIAVKQLVTIGNKNKEWIEILSPKLNPEDRIISEGNYELPDNSLVKIATTKEK